MGVSVPMLYAIACGDHRPAGAQSGREYRISRSLPKITSYSHLPPDDLCVRRARVAVAGTGPPIRPPPRSRSQNEAAPRPPSGQPPGSVSASLLVPRCRFAAPGPCSGGGARIRIAGEAAHTRVQSVQSRRAWAVFGGRITQTVSETGGVVSAGGPRFN